jgi:predicted RNase H-like HicB family nuclease
MSPTPMTPADYLSARPYAMVIEWSDADHAFIASIPDFGPNAWTAGKTRDEAARMGEEAIATLLASDAALGVPSPAPRFTVLAAEPQLAEAAT